MSKWWAQEFTRIFHLLSILYSISRSFSLLNSLVKNLIENAIVLLRFFLFALKWSRFLRFHQLKKIIRLSKWNKTVACLCSFSLRSVCVCVYCFFYYWFSWAMTVAGGAICACAMAHSFFRSLCLFSQRQYFISHSFSC